MVEGEAQGGEVGEAGGEISLGQVVLHEIQHLEISKGRVWGHLELSVNPARLRLMWLTLRERFGV